MVQMLFNVSFFVELIPLLWLPGFIGQDRRLVLACVEGDMVHGRHLRTNPGVGGVYAFNMREDLIIIETFATVEGSVFLEGLDKAWRQFERLSVRRKSDGVFCTFWFM